MEAINNDEISSSNQIQLEDLHKLSFLENSDTSKIFLTKTIKQYTNSKNNECINEFEILDYISRGLLWKVNTAKRYYYDDNKEIQSTTIALKKTHIRSLINMRYYENDQQRNFLDRVIIEILIHNLMHDCGYIAKLHEVLYDPSVEIDYNKDNQYMYYVMEYCDLGPLMIRNFDDGKYYYNFDLVKYVVLSNNIKFTKEDQKLFYNNTVKGNKQKDSEACSSLYVEKNKIPYVLLKKLCALFFKDIIKGIKELHKNRIVYNDIKPENICFKSKNINYIKKSDIKHLNDNKYEIKLIDFSTSTIVEKDNENYLVDYLTGTTCFQAPEIIMNKADGRKTDIWSLGICLYLFLTGEFPFYGEGELEVQMKTMKGEFNYPEYVENKQRELINKILVVDPFKRMDDLDSIRKELKSWLI